MANKSSMKKDYKDLMEKYINERNLKPRTVRTFKYVVEGFFEKTNLTYPDDVNKDIVLKWRRDRLCEVGAVTVNSSIGFLSAFYSLCIENGHLANRVNPFKGMRVKAKVGKDKSIDDKRIKLIFDYFDKNETLFVSDSSLFWKAVTMTLYHTGMRVSQLLNLTNEDINLESGWILMKADFSKNYHEYKVPISDALHLCLCNYKKSLRPRNGQFFNVLLYKGQPVKQRKSRKTTDAEVFMFYSKLSRALGFRITTHMFRHTLASDIILKTGNVVFAQKILGHLCLNSTAKYAHANIKELRQMMNDQVRNEIDSSLKRL